MWVLISHLIPYTDNTLQNHSPSLNEGDFGRSELSEAQFKFQSDRNTPVDTPRLRLGRIRQLKTYSKVASNLQVSLSRQTYMLCSFYKHHDVKTAIIGRAVGLCTPKPVKTSRRLHVLHINSANHP